VSDIFAYLKEREAVGRVGDYMTQQEDLTEKMRAILVDWLVEVHWKFKLSNETLFATVHLLDTFLSRKQVKRAKLQLIGVTCMLLAAKHEEIYPPEIKDFVHVTDRAYSREDILDMEVGILNTLHFELTSPSPLQFLRRYIKLMGKHSPEHASLAEYSLELSMVNYRSIRHAPSHMAAAALLLSNKVLKISPAWPPALIVATNYTEQQIKSCAKELCALLQQAEKANLQAVRKKFSHAQYHKVAKMVA
jgi:cyclin B